MDYLFIELQNLRGISSNNLSKFPSFPFFRNFAILRFYILQKLRASHFNPSFLNSMGLDKITNEEFLDSIRPEIMKRKLIQGSLFMTAFCIFESEVMDHLNFFFKNPNRLMDYLLEPIPNFERKTMLSEKFRNELKSYKNEAQSYGMHSLLVQYLVFWKNLDDTITKKEILRIAELQKIRNTIAHQMNDFLLNPKHKIEKENIEFIIELAERIKISYLFNFDIPCNSDFDNVEVKKEDIQSGVMFPRCFLDTNYEIFKE